MEAGQQPPAQGGDSQGGAPEPFTNPTFWDLGDRVRSIATETAHRVVAEAVARAVAEQLSGEALAARVGPLIEKAISQVKPAAPAAPAGPDEARVRELAAEVAGDIAPEKISKALAGLLGSKDVEGKLGDLAGQVAWKMVGERLGPALAQHTAGEAMAKRVRELAAEVAGPLAAKHLSAALPQLLGSPEFRKQVDAAAAEAARQVLAGEDAAALVRREATKLIAASRPPSREDVERFAMERAGQELGARTLPAGVEAAAERVAGKLLEKRMAAELGRLVSADEFHREVGELRHGLAGAAPAADLTSAAEEFRRGQAGFRTDINSLRDAMRKLAARLLELDPRVQAIAQHVFEEQLAADAFRERLERVAAKAAEPVVAAALKQALAGLPAEKQIRDLAVATFREQFTAAATALLADDKFTHRVRELAGGTASEVLKARLTVAFKEFTAGEPLTKRVRELAAEAAGPVAAEKSAAALTAHLGSKELEKRIGDVAGKLVGDRLKPALAEQLGSKELEKRISDVAGKLAAERLAQAMTEHLASKELEKRIGDVSGKLTAEKLTQALAEHLGSKELEKRVVKLARETSAEVFGARVTKVENDLERRVSSGDLERELGGLRAALTKCADAAELRALGESFGKAKQELAGAVDGLRANLEQEVRVSLEEGEKRSQELAGRLERAEEDLAGKLRKFEEELAARLKRAEDELGSLPMCLEAMGSVHQRLNRLDQSLDRMPPAEQVNAEIAELRQAIAAAEEKLPAETAPEPTEGGEGEPPAEASGAGFRGLAALARGWVARAREHLSQIEAELAEARAEGRLRALIREETGGMDKETLREQFDERLRETVLELIRGGELQEQLKVTIQKALAPVPGRRETTRVRGARGGGMEIPDAMAAPEFPVAGGSEETLQKLVDSDSFKVALDERFKVMFDYLKSEVIPKEVRKTLEAGGGQ